LAEGSKPDVKEELKSAMMFREGKQPNIEKYKKVPKLVTQ
jgi:hypothetical protein